MQASGSKAVYDTASFTCVIAGKWCGLTETVDSKTVLMSFLASIILGINTTLCSDLKKQRIYLLEELRITKFLETELQKAISSQN